ncbi:MAG: hypothetical protein RIC55_03125 [Pirellulaceae bacterium]
MTSHLLQRLSTGWACLALLVAGGVLVTIGPLHAQDRSAKAQARDAKVRDGQKSDKPKSDKPKRDKTKSDKKKGKKKGDDGSREDKTREDTTREDKTPDVKTRDDATPDDATPDRRDGDRRSAIALERFLFGKSETNDRKVTLKLARTTITDNDLRGLRDPKFADLEVFEAYDSQISDDGLQYLVGLSVTEVDLGSCEVTDRGLEYLTALPLRSLGLYSTEITDDGLRALRGLPLDKLGLGNTDITDDGLARLKGMPLRNLSLSGTRVTDDGLAHLRRLPLEGLGLPRQITDRGLVHLRLMPLRSLNLGGTSITDNGLRHLEGLPIKGLWLYGANLTDAAVASLERMPELDTVYIQDTQISEAAAERLRGSVRYVHTGREKPTYGQMLLEVFLADRDLERAAEVEKKDPFETRMIAQLIRAQGRPQAVKLGMDPNNIGITDFGASRFKREDRGYRGTVRFTFYPKRDR